MVVEVEVVEEEVAEEEVEEEVILNFNCYGCAL